MKIAVYVSGRNQPAYEFAQQWADFEARWGQAYKALKWIRTLEDNLTTIEGLVRVDTGLSGRKVVVNMSQVSFYELDLTDVPDEEL